MPLATRTELLEIVPELGAMAAGSKTVAVRDTLNLLANRYAAMAVAAACKDAAPRGWAQRLPVTQRPSRGEQCVSP